MRTVAEVVFEIGVRACVALLVLVTIVEATVAEDLVSSSAKTLLARKCLACHSGDEAKGKLDLTTREGLTIGGETGPAIVANTPETSLLWQRVEQDEMPPKHPLSADEKRLLKDWIAAGTAWTGGALDPLAVSSEHRAGLDWWSLQPLRRVRIPVAKSPVIRRQPVDDFIAEKLAARTLAMSPEADRHVLIRRISFDLLGLPPLPAEVDQFVQDDRPDAFERLVDGLLASPHYGERWARHWLDVVRFGESNGFERDLPRPNAWHYRDWVTNALNRDMAYDDFVRWQLAGDLLAPDDAESMKGVGFLVAGAHDTVVPVVDRMRAMMRQDELEDIVGTVSQTFLGLTVNCARCHDHKFDPITTREYYQLASALSGIDHGEREIMSLENGPLKVYTAIATQPPAMKVHKRGSVSSLGDEVAAAGLAAIRGPDPSFGLRPDAMESHRRLRLAHWITDARNPLFMRVMTNRVWHYHFGVGLVETPNDLGFHAGMPSHPDLLEWLAGEFGATQRRENTEAGEVDRGAAQRFSLKRLHRLLVNSASYRQSSTFNAVAAEIDANNRLVWRMSPRRLEAEAVRDAMLAVAGELNTEIGGQGYADVNSYFFKGTQFYDPIDPIGHANHRRTLYRMGARGGRSPFLDTFDCPDPSTTTPRRSSTVTPLQALSLLNHSFSLRMADHFANRLTDEARRLPGTLSRDEQIRQAFRLLYSRVPDEEELTLSREFISRRSLSEFCRALWNSSEFLFLD